MTTRRWMIVVAVAAMAMGGLVVARAVCNYLVAMERVPYHAASESLWRWLAQPMVDFVDSLEELRAIGDAQASEELKATLDEPRRLLAIFHQRVEYHAAMAAKYRRVARFPWLSVEPDPPEP